MGPQFHSFIPLSYSYYNSIPVPAYSFQFHPIIQCHLHPNIIWFSSGNSQVHPRPILVDLFLFQSFSVPQKFSFPNSKYSLISKKLIVTSTHSQFINLVYGDWSKINLQNFFLLHHNWNCCSFCCKSDQKHRRHQTEKSVRQLHHGP